MFIVPSFGCFISIGVGQVYTMPTAAERPRACRASQQGCIAVPGAYGTWRGARALTPISFWQSALITTSGDLIPECNDLSQFREDRGEPSVPVHSKHAR